MLIKILLLLAIFSFVPIVYADQPPIQTSPANGSTASSSILNWQTPPYSLYSTNPYRVQVDDDPAFSSLNKDYYTKNTYYTPKLSDGTWHWRVKAKDAGGTWSDWSSIWSFTLLTAASTPTPSVTTTPTPSPTPSPTSSFTISNTPSQINSDESFTITINLSLPDNPNTAFYLKGAFRHPDKPSNYFGLTKVSGNWVKNSSTYSNQYKITTDFSGNWSGTLEVQSDSEDSGFIGSGDYTFKVGRYTSPGSGPTWSNETNIKTVFTQSSNQGGNTTGVISDSSPSKTDTVIAPSDKTKTVISPQPKKYDKLIYQSASVAATATASATPSAKMQVKSQFINIIPWVGGLLVVSGIGFLIFTFLTKSKRQGSASEQ